MSGERADADDAAGMSDCVALYANGLSTVAIAAQLGISRRQVRRRLREAGVTMRRQGTYREGGLRPAILKGEARVRAALDCEVRYVGGERVAEISLATGLNVQLVRRLLREVGAKPPVRRRVTGPAREALAAECARLHREGYSRNAIAREVKHGPDLVRVLLVASGAIEAPDPRPRED